jgi:hypothetical protein
MQINTSSLFVNLNGRSPVLQNGFLKLIDKKMHSFYGGNEEITKANTLLYKYRRANPIKIFEKDQKSKPVENVSDVPHEFLVSLNKEEYSWDEFRFQKAFDIGGSGNLDEILSRLAASYVAASEHLNAHFSGTELETHRSQLDAAVSKVMKQQADVFAENVGGFLEKNGFAGEKDKINDIIASEYTNKIRQYSEFSKTHSDYVNLKGTEYEWLSEDIAYMAQELRRACDTAQDSGTSEERYSLEEISLANRLVEDLTFDGLFDSLGNEESFGLDAGMLLLKTQLFSENSTVSRQFADKMMKAVNTCIDDVLNRINDRIRRLYDDPYYDKEKSPMYDKSEIYNVSKMMLKIYKEKGTYSETILEGIEYALNRSRSKENVNAIVDRYKTNYYWKRFYDNSECFRQFYYSEGVDRRTSYQKLIDSWNSYAYDVSKLQGCQVAINRISVLA